MRYERLLIAIAFPLLGVTPGSTVFAQVDVETATQPSAARESVNVDRGLDEPNPTPSPTAAGITSTNTCTSFGGPGANQDVNTVFRGNFYQFTEPFDLREIAMELQFTGTVTFYFSIHQLTFPPAPMLPFFERVGLDVVVTATSDGTAPMFYSTETASSSLMPVTLMPGVEYMIGVAWAGASVRTFRTGAAMGGPVLAAMGFNLETAGVPPEPPIADIIPDSRAGPGIPNEAFSMRLCVPPKTGACCVPPTGGAAGFCDDTRLPSECTDPRGFFGGEDTLCRDIFCQADSFGPCCFADAPCADDYSFEGCAAAGGTWAGPGLVCQPGLCPPRAMGACCNESAGTCTVTLPEDCTGAGDVYSGDGTDCDPNLCFDLGVCCCNADGICAEANQSNCEAFCGAGAFKGRGTTCETLPPASECGGACCGDSFIGRQCLFKNPRSECKTSAGFTNVVYMGDALLCSAVTCDDTSIVSGACCLPDGTCQITEESFCLSFAGANSFTAGAACADVDCTTCCIGATDPTCERTAETIGSTDVCVMTVGGTPLGTAGSCVPNLCGLPTGACCFRDGVTACVADQTLGECSDLGGFFEEGLTCSDCPAVGSCCRPNGTCSENVTRAECVIFGGDVADGAWESGTSCASRSVPCPAPGACCSIGGVCSFIPESSCLAIGGTFRGEGLACSGSTCPTGACCGAGNECDLITMEACLGRTGSTYLGDATTCSPNECISLIDADPPNCEIDARQRSEPDGSNPADTIDVTFDGPATGVGLGSFTVEVFGGTASAPRLSEVSPGPDPNTLTLRFDPPPPTEAWLCVTYDVDMSQVCVGILPGDTDGDRTSEATDVVTLRDCLLDPSLCPLWHCDANRSGRCTPADLLRVIDLTGAVPCDPAVDCPILDVVCP